MNDYEHREYEIVYGYNGPVGIVGYLPIKGRLMFIASDNLSRDELFIKKKNESK